MTLEPVTDQLLIKSVLSIPDIWESAAEDSVDKETYWPSVDSLNTWLLCAHDGDICGIILAHAETACSVSIHPYLRKEFKGMGKAMMNELFKRFIEHAPKEFVKINAVIPDCFKATQNFAKSVGFTEEGKSRSSYLKGGKAFDRTYYGITRQEIEAIL